jgi:hypothetical protein
VSKIPRKPRRRVNVGLKRLLLPTPQVYIVHTPATQLFGDAVIRNDLADQRRGAHQQALILGWVLKQSQRRQIHGQEFNLPSSPDIASITVVLTIGTREARQVRAIVDKNAITQTRRRWR